MPNLDHLFENNRNWSKRLTENDPQFFDRLSHLQEPKYLWIGCSDSRVPANEILGLAPGEVFVHRNVANLVPNSDINCLSVLQFAVEVLKVEHVIVCGHYGCGGVRAACGRKQFGLIDYWLRDIKDVYAKNAEELDKMTDATARADRLCELNVIAQVNNVCHTTILQNAWAAGSSVSVHGLVYSLNDGLLRDLGVRIDGPENVEKIYKMEAA